MDDAIAGELERLRKEEGIVPRCRQGCCHCCRYNIVLSMAEAHALARHLKREWPGERIRELQARTRQWHAWDHSVRIGGPAARRGPGVDLTPDDPGCPLLVNGTCGAYPVRPVVCRTHFVSSPPRLCQAAVHPGSLAGSPVGLTTVVTAASPYSTAIRHHIEHAGLEFTRTQMLLPHWLAAEMGWNFEPACQEKAGSPL
jgi:Fe-S-cluster containining protein